MNEILVAKLKESRRALGLKQEEVAAKLNIKPNTLSNWENGKTEPGMDMIWKLCQLYGLDLGSLLNQAYGGDASDHLPSSQDFDMQLKYDSLIPFDQKTVQLFVNRIYERSRLMNETIPFICEKRSESTLPQRTLPYYNLFSSENSSENLFNNPSIAYVPVSRPYDNAIYAVRINGDDMLPQYHDGDYLLIDPTSPVELNSTGLYRIKGHTSLRRKQKDHLVSVNVRQKDIPYTSSVICLGKVIRTLRNYFENA